MSPHEPEQKEPDPAIDTEWSPKLTYPVMVSILGFIGIGFGLIGIANDQAGLSTWLIVVLGAVLLVIGIDQFRRTPRLQLRPDGLIHYGIRGKRFIPRELVYEVRLLRARRRGVAGLIRIEFFRDADDASRQQASNEPVDAQLVILTRTEVGGHPLDVADVLSAAGYRVINDVT